MSDLRTTMLLMAQYQRAVLTHAEVCDILGIAPKTGANWKSMGKFPIPLLPDGRARLQDVADWIDEHVKAA